MYSNFNWDIFFTLLKKKLIVPVIGNDLILIKTSKEVSLTLDEHITNQLAKHLKVNFNNLSLPQFISKHQHSTMVKSLVKHIYNEIDISDIDFAPLRKLAKITDFDTFLTLNFDGYFDNTLKSIRKNQNIQTINMSLSNSGNRIEKSIDDAIIFNIFGNIRTNTGYAKTESDLLEYTLSLFEQNYQNQLLRNKVANKSFLFIGNDLPEWIIPTLMRSISNEPFENAENIKFIVENEKDTMTSYSGFMSNFKLEQYKSQNNYKSNSLSFIDELYDRWKEFNRKQLPSKFNESVYINAPPENINEILKLYNVLKQKGFEVNYNTKVQENPYLFSKEVENQIKSSTIFITLISKDSLNSDKQLAYFKGLNVAEARHTWFHDSTEDSFIDAYVVDDIKKNDKNIPEFLRSFDIKKFNINAILKNVELKLTELYK